jgi:pseudoazurin
MNTLKTQIVAVLGLMLCAASVSAADIEIRMLDKSETEGMLAFEPSFVKAKPGDTLVFIPVNPGHNTSSLLIPAKAESWKSAYDNKEVRIKLEKEGVYLYVCDAHKPMGMVGVVQVGKAVNLEEVRKKVAEESARMVMNKDRFTKALEKVQ